MIAEFYNLRNTSAVNKIPISKLQINFNTQITMTETGHIGNLDIAVWNLFVIWCLEYGIYLLIVHKFFTSGSL